MPSHASEETAPSGLTDKVAQESSDSNASNHPIHDENKGPVEQAFNTGRAGGPQKPDNMPEAKSKEELKAKASEMNK
ncbi:hypothetical protein LTR70_008187 [Exophiala xenobiotica]|uniref:Conidiation-specific protein 6 n=1 Tax=Lithohypha guttulata TaxID=1690604 RepID=A0ABR0K1C8_9EURO|nr:hypothetical protein LTR24_007970 [Lithohypha guttulata]KAK5312417.1 hypothetical protein LTR70_008187 [Exophiala xenobiotica]